MSASGLRTHPGSAVLLQADDVQIKVSPQAIRLIKNDVSCQSVPLRLWRRRIEDESGEGRSPTPCTGSDSEVDGVEESLDVHQVNAVSIVLCVQALRLSI